MNMNPCGIFSEVLFKNVYEDEAKKEELANLGHLKWRSEYYWTASHA